MRRPASFWFDVLPALPCLVTAFDALIYRSLWSSYDGPAGAAFVTVLALFWFYVAVRDWAKWRVRLRTLVTVGMACDVNDVRDNRRIVRLGYRADGWRYVGEASDGRMLFTRREVDD